MRYVHAGEAIPYTIDFMVNGDYVVPDEDSVSYTIRDASGAPIPGHSGVAVVTDGQSDSVTIEIPAEVNTKTKDREPRYVHVRYTVAGRAYTLTGSYVLIDFLNFVVEPSDVRNWLGVTPGELPDKDIDLVKAYYAVKNDSSFANVDLPSLLAEGDEVAFAVNEAIRMQAAMQVLPSLENRIAQMERADQMAFQRGRLDIAGLRRRTASEYARLVQTVTGVTPLAPIFFTTSLPVDPVTGV